MAKRKNTSALFDVVSREQAHNQAFEVPEWMRSGRKTAQALPAEPSGAAEPADQVPGGEYVHEEPSRPAESREPAPAGAAEEPIWQRRVKLDLSAVTVGIIAAAALLLLVAVFAVGRRTGSGREAGLGFGAEAAREFDTQALQARHRERAPGSYSIVAQHNVPTLSQAQQVQKYYWLLGLDTTIVAVPGSGDVPAGYDVVDLTDMRARLEQLQASNGDNEGERKWGDVVRNRWNLYNRLAEARAWPLAEDYSVVGQSVMWYTHSAN